MDDLSNDEMENVSNAIEGGDAPEDAQSAGATATATQETSSSENKKAPHSTPQNNGPEIAHAQFMQLEEIGETHNIPPKELERLMDVKVHVEVVLGQTRMPIEKILSIHPGSILELDKLAGEPVEIFANGEQIARAEIVVIDDNFGVKIIDIVGTNQKFTAAQSV